MQLLRALIAFLCFLLVVLPAAVTASSSMAVIDDRFESIDIGLYMEYLADSSHRMTIDDVTDPNLEWAESDAPSFNFGFTGDAYWFRFTLSNRGFDGDLFYEITYPILNSIELYIPLESGGYSVKKGGNHMPFYEREIIDRNFIFYIPPEPGIRTYYMRIATKSSLNFKPLIYSRSAYISRINTELPIFWIYYGIMLGMLAYNLFLFVSIRERQYIYYSLFIIGFILFQLTLNGFSFQYLWPNWIWWANNSLPFMICMACFFEGFFVRTYLDTRNKFPWTDRILTYGSILPSFVWAVVSLVVNYRLAIIGATFVGLYTHIIMYGSGTLAMIYKSRAGYYIFVGFSLLMLGVTLYVLKTFGVLPSNVVTEWSIQIGSTLVLVLLSLGLADEINTMKKEVNLLNVDLKNLNLNLEYKVLERTTELEKAKNAIWGEMQLAKKIQTVLLPDNPEIPGYRISASMFPADDVGGDYYDIINVRGRDWLVIGDVSGHGIPAGIIMMMVQTAIRTAVHQNPDLTPAQLLSVINRSITANIRQLGEDKYMTITVFATHDDGYFHFAGLHQDILIYRSDRGIIETLETNGMWIGVVDDVSDMISDDTLRLNPGDVMLIYTDGITEAVRKSDHPDSDGPMFGSDKLEEVFLSSCNRPPEEIRSAILNELGAYKCDDDVTLVILERTDSGKIPPAIT